MTVHFGDLPTDARTGEQKGTRKQTDWDHVAKELRLHPGAWALAHKAGSPESASSTASALRRGQYRGQLPAGEFQVAWRGAEVWCRYVGPASDRPALSRRPRPKFRRELFAVHVTVGAA